MNWLIKFISNTLSIGINHFFKSKIGSNWDRRRRKNRFVHAVSCHTRIHARYVVFDHFTENTKRPNKHEPIDRVPVCVCVCSWSDGDTIADKIYAIVQSEHIFVWGMRHIIAAHRVDPQPILELVCDAFTSTFIMDTLSLSISPWSALCNAWSPPRRWLTTNYIFYRRLTSEAAKDIRVQRQRERMNKYNVGFLFGLSPEVHHAAINLLHIWFDVFLLFLFLLQSI